MKIVWIALVVILAGVCLTLYPIFYWFAHDDLTAMQIFKHYWVWVVIGLVVMSAGQALIATHQELRKQERAYRR